MRTLHVENDTLGNIIAIPNTILFVFILIRGIKGVTLFIVECLKMLAQSN